MKNKLIFGLVLLALIIVVPYAYSYQVTPRITVTSLTSIVGGNLGVSGTNFTPCITRPCHVTIVQVLGAGLSINVVPDSAGAFYTEFNTLKTTGTFYVVALDTATNTNSNMVKIVVN